MKTFQPIAYCVNCRRMVPVKDKEPVRLGNGKEALKGICSRCGTRAYALLTKPDERWPLAS